MVGLLFTLSLTGTLIELFRPHKGSNYFPKVPTTLVYRRDNESMVDWGHGAKRTMIKPHAGKHHVQVSNFKLLLDEHLGRTLDEPSR